MSLLDSVLAFALTMAALATVATIVMEIAIRGLGLRKKDQVALISRLYSDVIARAPEGKRKGDDKTPDETRWAVVKAVLENPFATAKMATSEAAQGFGWTRCAAIYDDISLEHVLRRVTEVEGLDDAIGKTKAEVTRKLTALGRKYDEYRSAVSADFRRRARFWSLLVGIGLAFVMNVDGIRLFQAYQENPGLAERVIDRMEPVLAEVETAQSALLEAQGAEVGKQQVEDLEKAIARLDTQVASIGEFGLPIGRLQYPHCLAFADTEERKSAPDARCQVGYEWLDSLTWFLKVLGTGLLIGLGAPFWYDVARRLAQVRRAFGGGGSAEQRHSGADASQALKSRDDLIAHIVEDALTNVSGAEGDAKQPAQRPRKKG